MKKVIMTPEFYIGKKRTKKIESEPVKSSEIANDFLRKTFDKKTIEVNETFIALFLNRGNDIIGWTMISSGGISSTVVDVRMVMKVAIDCMCSGIILAHNHPSGNLKASESDKAITKKIEAGAKLFDISLLDHLILTDEEYFSFADNGLI